MYREAETPKIWDLRRQLQLTKHATMITLVAQETEPPSSSMHALPGVGYPGKQGLMCVLRTGAAR